MLFTLFVFTLASGLFWPLAIVAAGPLATGFVLPWLALLAWISVKSWMQHHTARHCQDWRKATAPQLKRDAIVITVTAGVVCGLFAWEALAW